MKIHFEAIQELNDKSNATKALAVCKLVEEVGEMIQQINIDLGIKTGDLLLVKNNVKEELADSIQNLFSIADLYHITYDELVEELYKKNEKWNNIITNRTISNI